MSMVTDWEIELVRITAFPEDYSKISPVELWDQYIGEEPDKVQIERDKFDGRHKEYDDRIVALVKQERKIEWQYLIKQGESSSQPGLPSWGSLQAEIEILIEWSKRWLKCVDIMPVNRLAFGASLIIPNVDVTSAYSQLKEFLPNMTLENASDFSYQINRRRTSEKIADLQINRLSRWNVVILERSDSILDPAADGERNLTDWLYATRLELDINNVPIASSPLPTDSLTRIFEELVQLGLEIATEGDIA